MLRTETSDTKSVVQSLTGMGDKAAATNDITTLQSEVMREADEYADAVLDRLATTRAVVPALWPLEVANALLMGERRKRSTEAETIKWTGILASLPIVFDGETNAHAWSDTLSLARGHNLTAYDAAYLELAIRRGLPLATIDGKLKRAAETVGIALFDVS
jgi:predicted nucleic acid-binding protein